MEMYIHMKVLLQDLSTKFLFLIVLKSGRLPGEVFRPCLFVGK